MLTAVREQLAAELAEIGVPVHTAWPDRLSPPCALLVPPSGTYVTGGQVFGSYTVALDLVLLAERGSFDVVLPALETLIDAALRLTESYGLSGVDSPSVVTIGGIDYLGTTLHISKQVMGGP